jgi:hypothetical protein
MSDYSQTLLNDDRKVTRAKERFRLSEEQAKRFVEIQRRSVGQEDSGVHSHYPIDVWRMMAVTCRLNPYDESDLPIWYALVGDRWSMFYHSNGPIIRALMKPCPSWQKLIQHFNPTDELHRKMALPERITVYRGVPSRDRLSGWSWTTEHEVAVRFALQYGKVCADTKSADKVPTVTSGSVRSAWVLGTRNCRGESEVIVDPRLVKHREIIAL